MSWFAVRSFYRFRGSPDVGDSTYEERVVLFEAPSANDAIAAAEAEASEYVEQIDGEVLPCFQSYALAAEPGASAEVFSLMRDSALEPDEYLDTFFDTGRERTDGRG
ncbi:hypothetical protein [Cellulomonas sp. HZM]|uniref:hypothetical protein n=1 Tax=Cellulomonas sp. HZM TaxID=1454010 RepID=UPI000493915F|nr:hypothetical protein [Cellulomonas sp. HZM]